MLSDSDETQSETLGLVEARVLGAGLGSGVDVWRVQLVESGLRVNARTRDESNFKPGDCVLVRQFRGDLITRRDVIVDHSSGC